MPRFRETKHRAVFEVSVTLDEEEEFISFVFERADVGEEYTREGRSEVAATKLDQCAGTSAPSACVSV